MMNHDVCYAYLLSKSENFTILHDACVHAGFCKTCANHLLELEANSPICRSKISVALKCSNNYNQSFSFNS